MKNALGCDLKPIDVRILRRLTYLRSGFRCLCITAVAPRTRDGTVMPKNNQTTTLPFMFVATTRPNVAGPSQSRLLDGRSLFGCRHYISHEPNGVALTRRGRTLVSRSPSDLVAAVGWSAELDSFSLEGGRTR